MRRWRQKHNRTGTPVRNPGTACVLACTGVLLFSSFPAQAQSRFQCTAWGGSHTGRYTFEITTDPCAIRWLEIDRKLEILVCRPPILKAVKPFAPAKGYELHFNLETGTFSDHVPGWADRGSCKAAVE